MDHLYNLELIDFSRHSLNHIAFVDSHFIHVPMYPNELSITLALWTSSTTTTRLDKIKAKPFISKNTKLFRNIISSLGLSSFFKVKSLSNLDFYPIEGGFKLIPDRRLTEYSRGPIEHRIQTIFSILQSIFGSTIFDLIDLHSIVLQDLKDNPSTQVRLRASSIHYGMKYLFLFLLPICILVNNTPILPLTRYLIVSISLNFLHFPYHVYLFYTSFSEYILCFCFSSSYHFLVIYTSENRYILAHLFIFGLADGLGPDYLTLERNQFQFSEDPLDNTTSHFVMFFIHFWPILVRNWALACLESISYVAFFLFTGIYIFLRQTSDFLVGFYIWLPCLCCYFIN